MAGARPNHQENACRDQKDQGHDHGQGGGEGVGAGDRCCRPQGGQVPGEHRCAPVEDHEIVERPPHAGGQVEDQTADHPAAGEGTEKKIQGPQAHAVAQGDQGRELPGEHAIGQLHQIGRGQGWHHQGSHPGQGPLLGKIPLRESFHCMIHLYPPSRGGVFACCGPAFHRRITGYFTGKDRKCQTFVKLS